MSNLPPEQMTASVSIQTYPCDRGIPGNLLGRGYHNFQGNLYGVFCTFCGKPPLATG